MIAMLQAPWFNGQQATNPFDQEDGKVVFHCKDCVCQMAPMGGRTAQMAASGYALHVFVFLVPDRPCLGGEIPPLEMPRWDVEGEYAGLTSAVTDPWCGSRVVASSSFRANEVLKLEDVRRRAIEERPRVKKEMWSTMQYYLSCYQDAMLGTKTLLHELSELKFQHDDEPGYEAHFKLAQIAACKQEAERAVHMMAQCDLVFEKLLSSNTYQLLRECHESNQEMFDFSDQCSTESSSDDSDRD
jgi:hypothetical protein